jgi:hypothetical protein
MNLREIAFKKLTEELLGECEEEYRQMYHNASFCGEWPDFDAMNKGEIERYFDCLSDLITDFCHDLEEELNDCYGGDWILYQYGRSGATIAPDGFSHHGNMYCFNRTLDLDKIFCLDDCTDPEDPDADPGDLRGESWVDAYQAFKKHLAAFKLINERVRSAAATDLAEWWEDMKAANKWTFGEEEEDPDKALQAEAAG